MKRTVAYFMLFALIGLWGSVANVKAQKSTLTTENGWTKITSMPSNADLNKYFFAFFDHTQDLGLVLGQGNHQVADYKTMYYRANVDPLKDPAALWTITVYNGNLVINNVTEPELILQTENNQPWYYRTHDNGGGAELSWGYVLPAYDNDNEYWTIQNGKYPGEGANRNYLGPWDETFVDGAEVAFNKISADFIGHFDVYTIERSTYLSKKLSGRNIYLPEDISYMISNPGGNMAGWTKELLTDTHEPALGNTDPAYIFQGQTNDGLAKKEGVGFFEAWRNGDANMISDRWMYQDISGLPAGKYDLNLRTDATQTGAFMFIKNGAGEADNGTNTMDLSTNHGGWATVSTTLTAGNTLRIGVKLQNYQDHWVKFDDFRLVYHVPEAKWNEVSTSLPANPNDYFFTFSDSDGSGLGMVLGPGNNNGAANKTMIFAKDFDPMTDKAALWTMVQDGEYYVITGVADPEFMLQTEENAAALYHTNDNGGGGIDWGRVKPEYRLASWTIQNGKYPEAGYLGAWNAIEEGDEVAANVPLTDERVVYFSIYALKRGKYVEYAETTNPQMCTDISYVLTNSEATRHSMVGWTMENTGALSSGYIFQTQNNGELNNASKEWFFEAWQANGILSNRQMSQTFSEMPAGRYTLSVRTDAVEAGAFLFIKDVTNDLEQSIQLNAHTDGVVKVELSLASSATLQLGVRLDGYQSNFVKFDDFRLEYSKPITEMPTEAEDLNDYFFVFRDHNNPNLGLILGQGVHQGTDRKTMFYSNACSPMSDLNSIWTIANWGNNTLITSPNYPEFMLQTEDNASYFYRTNDNGAGGMDWGNAIFSLADAATGWTIQNGKYPGDGENRNYLGPWDETFVDGAEVAFNKTGANIGYFDIFKIKRGEYVSKVETEKAKLGPVDISYIITNTEATRSGNRQKDAHGNTVGWTLSAADSFWAQGYNSGMANKSGIWYFEAWQQNGRLSNRKMSQTFTDMPDGQYTLTVSTRPEHADTGAYLFINDERADFTSKDPNGVVTVVANVTGGTLSIGVELIGCQTNWVSFDKFELTWSLAKPQVGEGRYILKNCGRKCYLKHGTGDNIDKTAASPYFGGRDAAWDFVRSAFPNQYYIRNVENGTYLQWTTENNGKNLPLVADPLDATLFSFDTNTHVHEGCVSIRIIGAAAGKPYLNAFGNDGRLGNYSADEQSDWILFPVSEPMPVLGTDYLIINKESGNYATRQAANNATLVQNTKGAVDGTNSVWTLATSNAGYTMTCGGNKLASLAGTTFTAEGVTWYIKKVCTDISHFVISSAADLSGNTCWHNNGGNAIDSDVNSDPASRWRFVPVEEYYQNALAYLSSLYSDENKDKPFYLSETAYNNLKDAAHATAAEQIAAANAMYNVLNNIADVVNMPENGKEYLIKNVGFANHYVNTDETRLVLGANYNSTYFWRVERDGTNNAFRLRQCCYDPAYSGTDPLQYKEDMRFIKHEQPTVNQQEWQYEATQATFPVSFDFYATELYPIFGSASVMVGVSRMNAYNANSTVITWDGKDDYCKWEFVTVEEASAPLIATAESVYEAGNNGPFTLTADAKAEIRTAINNLKNEYSYQNYWILENLLNNPSSFATLPEGRYLVRNYNYDYTRDGYPEDTETYLTALTNTMGVVEEALNYWSIWDVKKTADGYTMQCEGNSLVHAPGHPLDGNPNTDERDNGFLYYAGIHDGNDQYWVGNTTEQTLYINPAFSLQLGNVDRPLVGSYASISSKEHPSKYLYQWTVGIGNWIDNVVYAQEYQPNNNNAAWKTAFLWEFTPLTAEKEAEIFQNQVDGLAGYVGGVVTLTDVESVPCLQDIVDLRDAAVTAIKNGTTLAYTAPAGYDNLTVNDASQVGPQAYRAILDKINDIKRNSETKKYYQDLRPTETLDNGKEVKHPFFMENFSGTRPSYGARLTEGDGNAWLTRPKNEVVDKAGAFYVTRTRNELIDANGIVTQEAQYQLLNGNGYSLDHRSNTPGEHFSINRTLGNDKMTFEIEPVIPGVWKMRDAEVVAGAWPYVTVTAQYGMSGGLQYYNRVEVSTLWKFQTFNELDTIFVRVAPTATTDGNYFCTYSNTLNIEVPVENNPVPYYCSAAYYHKANEDAQTSTALKVVLTQMPNDGTNYYLKHDAGYLFMTKSGTNINEVGDPLYNPSYPNAVFVADAKYMTGSIDGFIAGDKETRKPAYEDNLFVGNAKWPIEITPENWRNIYALGYAAGNTQVGIYHGVPVMGRGMGFYHIKLGGVLKAGSAYIPSKAFSDEDGDFTPINALEVHESGMPVEILFEDEEGNMVDRIELTSDGNMKHMADGPIYDLAGRQVSRPMHGIYIQNGRKVYFK